MPRRLPFMLWFGIALGATSLSAQFTQYVAPGSLAQMPKDRKETLERAIEDARWKVGGLRLDPWLGMSNAGWVDDGKRDADGKELDPDFTASIGAGLRAYLPRGRKMILAAHALPEYVYWVDREDDRQSAGRYGLGFFAYFNRLTIETTAVRDERQTQVTAETFLRVDNRLEKATMDLDLRVGGSLSVFVGAVESRFRYLVGDQPELVLFRNLDRDESTLRGGLRYRRSSGFSLGVGGELSKTEGASGSRGLASDASAPFVELYLDRSGLKFQASVARWTIEPRGGGATVEETTGTARLGLFPEGRLVPSFYASRYLAYTVNALGGHTVEVRYGLSVRTQLGWRTGLSAFLEQGTSRVLARSELPAGRQDELTAWGALVTLQIGRDLAIVLGGGWTEYESDFPGLDRRERQIRVGLALGGPGAAWE